MKENISDDTVTLVSLEIINNLTREADNLQKAFCSCMLVTMIRDWCSFLYVYSTLFLIDKQSFWWFHLWCCHYCMYWLFCWWNRFWRISFIWTNPRVKMSLFNSIRRKLFVIISNRWFMYLLVRKIWLSSLPYCLIIWFSSLFRQRMRLLSSSLNAVEKYYWNYWREMKMDQYYSIH